MEQLKITDNRITAMEPTPDLPATQDPTAVVMAAIQKGFDPDLISKMMDLAERQQANLARQAYHEAMAAFKANPPEIEKDRKVKYRTDKGAVEYSHASLANVTQKINSGLGQHGLSAGWETVQSEKGITVTCTITHKLGHSESTSLTAAADNSGSKNSIQAIGSTISYLERYTLLALTGLATADMDNDGAQAEEFISEAQAKEIENLIKAKSVDKAKFLRYMGVESIKGISVSEYGRAISALKAKKKTIPCPNQDGRDVNVAACEKCKMRQGCPSWEGQK